MVTATSPFRRRILTFGTHAVGSLLAVLLVFASTVDLVSHDHHAAPQLDGISCVVDHAHATEPGTASKADAPSARPAATRSASTPLLSVAGHGHQHHCLGCRLQNQRTLLTAADSTALITLPPTRGASLPDGNTAPRFPLSNRTLRGPPSA